MSDAPPIDRVPPAAGPPTAKAEARPATESRPTTTARARSPVAQPWSRHRRRLTARLDVHPACRPSPSTDAPAAGTAAPDRRAAAA